MKIYPRPITITYAILACSNLRALFNNPKIPVRCLNLHKIPQGDVVCPYVDGESLG